MGGGGGGGDLRLDGVELHYLVWEGGREVGEGEWRIK